MSDEQDDVPRKDPPMIFRCMQCPETLTFTVPTPSGGMVTARLGHASPGRDAKWARYSVMLGGCGWRYARSAKHRGTRTLHCPACAPTALLDPVGEAA